MTSTLTPDPALILATYRRATRDQLARGLSWYADAHSIALALDPENVTRAAGVLSALSPRLQWSRNVTLAARAYADGQASGCLGNSCRAANRILAGEDPTMVLRAPKTRNFLQCIADPTDPHAVVIDRHAFDIAVGRVTSDDERAALSRKGTYDAYADAYRTVARIVGVSPSTVQAVTWTVWRETESLFRAANVREVNAA